MGGGLSPPNTPLGTPLAGCKVNISVYLEVTNSVKAKLVLPAQKQYRTRNDSWFMQSMQFASSQRYITYCLFCFLLSQNIKISLYRRVSVRVVLYGCATWSLTLREEHGLRVFENRVQRGIFGAQRDEVTEMQQTIKGGSPQFVSPINISYYWVMK